MTRHSDDPGGEPPTRDGPRGPTDPSTDSARDSRGPRVVIVMGVSGSGKTTIGHLLAVRMGWAFVDADDHHPPANVAKMARGEPLTDQDRMPWLARLRAMVDDALTKDAPMVLACSALKQRYREILGVGDPHLALVYLRGDEARIAERMRARSDHFFQPALLHSQFEALEEPEDALVVDVDATPEDITSAIVRVLSPR
jgi:gluconokinase